MSDVLEIEVNGIDGQSYKLDKYRGQVVLIVNTASKCARHTNQERWIIMIRLL